MYINKSLMPQTNVQSVDYVLLNRIQKKERKKWEKDF